MTELAVVQGDRQEKLFFEVGPSVPTAGGRGSADEVSIKEWFKDNFRNENSPGAVAKIGTTIEEVASEAAAGFRGMATDVADGGNFSEAEVTFGLKFSAEGTAFVAKTGVEAHISVTFKWDFTK